MIIFKEKIFADQFWKVDSRLRHILFALSGFVSQSFGKDIVVTSALRDDPGSLHAYGRAFDIRIEQVGNKHFTDEETEQIKEFVSAYEYDEKHKTLFVHGEPPHGHLQVNSGDYTKLRKI